MWHYSKFLKCFSNSFSRILCTVVIYSFHGILTYLVDWFIVIHCCNVSKVFFIIQTNDCVYACMRQIRRLIVTGKCAIRVLYCHQYFSCSPIVSFHNKEITHIVQNILRLVYIRKSIDRFLKLTSNFEFQCSHNTSMYKVISQTSFIQCWMIVVLKFLLILNYSSHFLPMDFSLQSFHLILQFIFVSQRNMPINVYDDYQSQSSIAAQWFRVCAVKRKTHRERENKENQMLKINSLMPTWKMRCIY